MISSNKYETLSYSQLLTTTKHLDQITRVYGTYINDVDDFITELVQSKDEPLKFDTIVNKIKEKKRVKDAECEQLIAKTMKKVDRQSPSFSGSNLFLDRGDEDEDRDSQINSENIASKFNKITDANRTLMSTSDFDKIAKEMTRLKKETKLFESYSEHMMNHYNEMKKCLQESLNKRSSECDYVFRKELIDDGDIVKLNENEMYFSAALTNQRLHQHISLDLIEATHQKFLDRIVIYVETLIQFVNENLLRMNKGSIANNNRVSFEPIRVCFAQMSKLRENPQIAAKTHTMYNEILETIVNLVQQIKFEIVNSFNLILNQQRENHHFDYSKFWNNLKTLTKLKWLEEYKKNAYTYPYTDIGDSVGNYLESLQFSLAAIPFGLDNHKQILRAYEIVKTVVLNEPIIEIYPEFDSLISKMKNSFREELSREFKNIANSFNTSQDSNSHYELSYEYSELALSYIENCKTIMPIFLNADYSRAQRNIRDHLKNRIEFIKRELESSIRNIEDSNLEANEKTHNMCSYLNEIEDVKQNYPKTYKFFPQDFSHTDFVFYWSSIFNEKYETLKAEIDGLKFSGDMQGLNRKLSLVKAFSKLDGFLKDDRFSSLFNENSSIARKGSHVVNAFDEAKPLIDDLKFEKLGECLLKFNSLDEMDVYYLNQLKYKLNNKLVNLCKSTKLNARILDELEENEIKIIKENMDYVQQAKLYLKPHIDTIQAELDTFEVDIKSCVNKAVQKYMKNIEDLLKTKFDAEKKINHILSLKSDLRFLIDTDLLVKISDLKLYEANLVMESVRKFETCSIEEFATFSPKEIHEKLQKSGGSSIEEAKVFFNRIILEKYRTKFDYVKRKDPFNIENEHLRKCEMSLNYLPDELRENVTRMLEETKREIKDSTINVENSFLNRLNDDDFQNALKYYTQNPQSKQMNDMLSEKLAKILTELNHNINNKGITELMASFEVLHKLNTYFANLFPKIRGEHESFLFKIKKLFTNSFSILMDLMLNRIENSEEKEKNLDHVNQSFEIMLRVIELDAKYAAENIFNNSPRSIFRDKFSQVTHKLDELIFKSQSSYSHAIEVFDVALLRDSLDSTKFYTNIVLNFDQFNGGNSEMLTYEQMRASVLERINVFKQKFIDLEFLTIKDDAKRMQSEFDAFFDQVNTTLILIRKINENLRKHFPEARLDLLETDCLASLEIKLDALFHEAINSFDRIILNTECNQIDLNQFYTSYYNIGSSEKALIKLNFDVNLTSKLEKILIEKLRTKIKTLTTDIEEKDYAGAARCMIDIKKLSNKIFFYKESIDADLDTIINSYISKRGGFGTIGKLAIHLKEDVNGSIIVTEHKQFEAYRRAIFNRKTLSQDIDYVLKNIKGTHVDVRELQEAFLVYRTNFDELIVKYIRPKVDAEVLVRELNKILEKIRQKNNKPSFQWDSYVLKELPILIAHIFALWTFLNSKSYFSNETDYLFLPHPAQVVSIFRMLGIGNSASNKRTSSPIDGSSSLKNNLVQIGTGEGKSVTLAVAAAVLSLLGFDIYCVCYSEYLSKRDFQMFKPLFECLNLVDNIRYGTFNRICEDVINKNGDIRKIVENYIINLRIDQTNWSDVNANSSIDDLKAMKLTTKGISAQRPRVLLIDEVDVFFTKEFYGNVYQPSLNLSDPSIVDLIKYIWKQRKSGITLRKLKEADEFKSCCKKFGEWKKLIAEACKDMLSELKNFETHEYCVKDDKISYTEQHITVFDTVYGYKTLFAYFLEHQNGRISEQSLNENISILIRLGSFSYAEIPCSNFNAILGVTGTLETLSLPEKTVIENVYRIKSQTIIPSVYGRNNLRFDPKSNVTISNEENHFQLIAREIQQKIVGQNVGTKRAVFLFFESKQELEAFYQSDAFLPYKSEAHILTEEANAHEKTYLINSATTSGKITLCTRTFGRGTDFIAHDQIVSANGGVHVIQTFLSEEFSEEIQIRGRTARQGEDGSYSLIVNIKTLEKFLIFPEELQALNANNLYAYLDNKRNEFFDKQYKENTKYIDSIKEKHVRSNKFLENIFKQNLNEVREFLIQENKGVEIEVNSKTLILMDATASMYYLLEKTKKVLVTMFERVSEILDEHGLSENSFEVKIAVYRNYNSLETKILQASSWESKPQNLINFLQNVRAEGGWGNEAIEIGLWQANQETNLSQVILIGDSPANSLEEIEVKRFVSESKGIFWYNSQNFSKKTYYQDELNELIKKKITVHAFYVDNKAKKNFEEIAHSTGGKTQRLDIESENGSKILTDLVNIELLRNIGGKEKGTVLVNAYKNKYNAF